MAKVSFSDSEFSRLFVVLRFDHDVRASFLASGQKLKKEKQRRGEKSRDFGDEEIEPTFNDPNGRLNFDCGDAVKGAGPSPPPLVKRTGRESELIDKSWRTSFNDAYNDYNRSGSLNLE